MTRPETMINEILNAAQDARSRIADQIRNTPLEHSGVLSSRHGSDVFLKLDNLQVTGSFKIRGAMAKLSLIPKDVLERGIVTASSGNHGAAVACAISQLGGSAIVFVPDHASQIKCDAIQRYGAQVQRHGDDGLVTELHARHFALEHDRLYISPYNDPEVIAGQGTMGLEIFDALPDVDAVFVTVGGGGLIAGVAGVLKALRPAVRIVGCQPSNDAAMMRSVEAGKILEIDALPTISDGSAGNVEPGSITFELCQTLVDEWVEVSESEIMTAMRDFIESQHQLLEGAAGVALAAFAKVAEAYRGRRVVIVICGAKIGLDKLKNVLEVSP
jgi:threonine dehydratase